MIQGFLTHHGRLHNWDFLKFQVVFRIEAKVAIIASSRSEGQSLYRLCWSVILQFATQSADTTQPQLNTTKNNVCWVRHKFQIL